MGVAMVNIGRMRMGVRHRLVRVLVRMWLSSRHSRRMLVLMMHVVHMRMGVGKWFMAMLMVVALGDVNPHADDHQP
jgi:hypothetical protein